MPGRRFKLGDNVVTSAQTPTLTLSDDGESITLKFSAKSMPTPAPAQDTLTGLHTHRDIVPISGGTALGSDLIASFLSIGDKQTLLSIRMIVNSKVPGTGGE